jgi:glycosyltransferase involved in cell wall biosynthesis
LNGLSAIAQRLIELLSNAGLRRVMGETARQRILREFPPEQIADRYLKDHAGNK